MNTREEREGNKLIAVFMDYEYTPRPIKIIETGAIQKQFGWNKKKQWYPTYIREIYEPKLPLENYHLCPANDELKFHYSWDWIMPVVEKIRSLGHTVDINTFYYSEKHPINNGCRITYDKQRPMTAFFFNENTDDMKRCIWESVVEFVKWYNQKN